MKKFFIRIKSVCQVALIAYKHPEVLVQSHFEGLAKIYETIFTVQEERHPMMFQVGVVFPGNEHHCIATVWVGAGADSSPTKRIQELNEEIQYLTKQIQEVYEENERLKIQNQLK